MDRNSSFLSSINHMYLYLSLLGSWMAVLVMMWFVLHAEPYDADLNFVLIGGISTLFVGMIFFYVYALNCFIDELIKLAYQIRDLLKSSSDEAAKHGTEP